MKLMTILLLFVIKITKVFSEIDIECTEFNKSGDINELDISKIIKELVKLNLQKNICENDAFNKDFGVKNQSKLLVSDLVERYNYSMEEHIVTTSDGYVLTMFRIPRKGPAVFLMHGLFGTSTDWVLAGNTSLAYLLADAEYDVWMGNSRGNMYSRKHMMLTPDCEEFWDYSFEEIGRYDLLSMIEYALDSSQKKTISYVGHNEGTTAFFVLCAEFPRFCENISIMVALAPVAFVFHTRSPILKILSYETDVKYILLKAIGSHEIIPNADFLKELALNLCDNNESFAICSTFNLLLFGFHQKHLDSNLNYTFFDIFPSMGSTKQLLHYAQEIESGLFRKYDYDETTNMNRYGFLIPPSYALEKITVPIALLYSDNDWFSNTTDVKNLKENLPNVIKYDMVSNYNYIDWLTARNVKDKVYDDVLKLLK